MSDKEIKRLLQDLRSLAGKRRSPGRLLELWRAAPLAETWAASVFPFLDDNVRVRAVHNQVVAGMAIDDAFPYLVTVLVEHADQMEKHAIRLASLAPAAPIIIQVAPTKEQGGSE